MALEAIIPVRALETDRNIANKISRGRFTAAFLLECLVAIGVQVLRIDLE
jgi:Domain of unknown function (DUF6471)